MKTRLLSFYKGLTKKRNLRVLNTGFIVLIFLYSTRTYLTKRDIREKLHRIEVLKSNQRGFVEGLGVGILAKNDKKIEKKLSETIK